MPAPAQSRSARDTFTGYGGVGDYAKSNGDPWSVVTAGRKISQGDYAQLPANIPDTGESFDLLVVGGGLMRKIRRVAPSYEACDHRGRGGRRFPADRNPLFICRARAVRFGFII